MTESSHPNFEKKDDGLQLALEKIARKLQNANGKENPLTDDDKILMSENLELLQGIQEQMAPQEEPQKPLARATKPASQKPAPAPVAKPKQKSAQKPGPVNDLSQLKKVVQQKEEEDKSHVETVVGYYNKLKSEGRNREALRFKKTIPAMNVSEEVKKEIAKEITPTTFEKVDIRPSKSKKPRALQEDFDSNFESQWEKRQEEIEVNTPKVKLADAMTALFARADEPRVKKQEERERRRAQKSAESVVSAEDQRFYEDFKPKVSWDVDQLVALTGEQLAQYEKDVQRFYEIKDRLEKEPGQESADTLIEKAAEEIREEKNALKNVVGSVAEEMGVSSELVSESDKEEIANELMDEPVTKEDIQKESSIFLRDNIKKYIRRTILWLGIAAGVGSTVAPLNFKKGTYTLNNAIENTTSVLTDDMQQSALRGLTKWGLYDPTGYEETVSLESIDMPPVKTVEEILQQKLAEKQRVDSLKQHEEYKKSNTYFQILGKVRDSHYKARKGVQDSLIMIRNQFFNEDGFEYVGGAVKTQMEEGESYAGVEGVAHFMILDDYGIDVSDKTSADTLAKYSQDFKERRIGRDIEPEDYVPVFSRDGERVTVRYKKAKELEASDTTITKLHQHKFGDIDFGAKVDGRKFGFSNGGVYGLRTYEGEMLPNFLYTSAGKDAYSRFSGSSVVFIFTDKQGNEIVRDFSGSINMVQQEGENIVKEFEVDPKELIVGVYDAGSYTAKPAAKDGVLEAAQYTGYNTLHPNSGGSLIIPKQK